ncbi:hypothetical protein BOTCAL_0180g00020 [Botryotinia calthae]|uniref:CCHC-type domain-containing protein n=1 Tax=Botryotinia calthae TaxID=38488 RepID=A0A4Y8D2Y9_9HELO|nr:hypothetical protein BOTCAL_0180g00020 [Botryotinia calthae]
MNPPAPQSAYIQTPVPIAVQARDAGPDLTTSRNNIVNGSEQYDYTKKPMCFKCGNYGHTKPEFPNQSLQYWEQVVLRGIVFPNHNTIAASMAYLRLQQSNLFNQLIETSASSNRVSLNDSQRTRSPATGSNSLSFRFGAIFFSAQFEDDSDYSNADSISTPFVHFFGLGQHVDMDLFNTDPVKKTVHFEESISTPTPNETDYNDIKSIEEVTETESDSTESAINSDYTRRNYSPILGCPFQALKGFSDNTVPHLFGQEDLSDSWQVSNDVIKDIVYNSIPVSISVRQATLHTRTRLLDSLEAIDEIDGLDIQDDILKSMDFSFEAYAQRLKLKNLPGDKIIVSIAQVDHIETSFTP